jgi:hypothetical protein
MDLKIGTVPVFKINKNQSINQRNHQKPFATVFNIVFSKNDRFLKSNRTDFIKNRKLGFVDFKIPGRMTWASSSCQMWCTRRRPMIYK